MSVLPLLVLGVLLTPHATLGAQQSVAAPAPGGTRSGRLFITTLNVRDLGTALRFFTEGLGMREQGIAIGI